MLFRSVRPWSAKRDFECFAELNGVKLEHFRADNHPFDSKEWLDDLETNGQTMSLSGTGAHHQNGAAERALQTITYWARAMMMHQLLNWPSEFQPNLWPFALEHAVYVWNHLPRNRLGLSPLKLFTGMKQPDGNKTLLQARVWGCPA